MSEQHQNSPEETVSVGGMVISGIDIPFHKLIWFFLKCLVAMAPALFVAKVVSYILNTI
jgi:hypothetical protein